ncbi:hypothetical protein KUV50_16885 [Membranicola marinus]|uniref:Amino acid ABC transporter substrate-binding protein n=1 Tax=Membranihabitans marinus TaxID=1227546 RepID=A0A953L8H6_9BACT|nr:hypothetical protein [Membranihabitans marinus]MBY5959832.1 hypothetical protein [Membranihabitans marinus]
MISVQSHLQPSNGNKSVVPGLILLIFVAFSVQSCGFIENLFQGKKEKTRPDRPKEEEKVVIQEIEWEDVTDLEEVIKDYPDKVGEKQDIYDVLCLLPFGGAHKNKGQSFYAGLKMAANSAHPSVNIRVTTFDVARLDTRPEALRKILATPEFDLVISPYSTTDVNNVIELTQSSGATVLSPWNTSPDIHKFPKYVQLNPGLESHLSGMVDWTAREYGVEQTLILSHKKEADLVRILKKNTTNLEEYFTSSNPKEDINELTQLMASKNVKAIIIPSWRSSDEAYFLSLLSSINAARRGRSISVFVLSPWMDNDHINFSQFSGMNLHFTSSRFIDTKSRAFQRFESEFMNKYSYFANEDVYYGHDIFLMMMDWLSSENRKLTDEVINTNCRDCFFRYNFRERISDEGQPYISNDHVDIISFKDFEYRRIN